MKIECHKCASTYIIPEERLPSGKRRFAFPCPSCKEIITVNLDQDSTTLEKTPEDMSSLCPSPDEIENNKRRILTSLKDLPPMPQVVLKARDVMANPEKGTKDLAAVLEHDPAIATRVLRVANSAYYGLSGKVSSIQHATVLLGGKRVAEIVSMSGVSRFLDKVLNGYGMESGELWRHSLAVAFGTRMIVTRKNPELANDAFIAGLIHDAGKMILDRHIYERKALFDEFLSNEDCTFFKAEEAILGFTHSEIAYEACTTWNIPASLTQAVRYHHTPEKSDNSELAYAVNVANTIALMSGIGSMYDGLLYSVDEDALNRFLLSMEDIVDIMCDVVESVMKVEEETKAF